MDFMKKNICAQSLVVAGAILIAGCGTSAGPQHTLRPPDPPGSYKVPTTKAEKIAAINRSPLSPEGKQAAIAKVNASPGP